MLKKTLIIALIGLMVGGVVIGLVSLADRSTPSSSRGGQGAELDCEHQPQGQHGSWRSEAVERGSPRYSGHGPDTRHEGCDDCASGEGHGAAGQSTSASTSGYGRGSKQAGGRYAQEQAAGMRNGGSGSAGRGGQGNAPQLNPQADPVEALTVEGTVTALGDDVTLELNDGSEMDLCMGPVSYRDEVGFDPQVGDELTVTGFYEDDEFKVISVLDETGTPLTFRDEYGRPMWAGRGRRAS